MKVYAVVDKKAKQFVCIFTAVNDEFAIRSFEMLLTDPDDTIYNLFPSQFALMSIGYVNYDGILTVRNNDDEIVHAVSDVVIDGDEYSEKRIEIMRKKRYAMHLIHHKSYTKTTEELKEEVRRATDELKAENEKKKESEVDVPGDSK